MGYFIPLVHLSIPAKRTHFLNYPMFIARPYIQYYSLSSYTTTMYTTTITASSFPFFSVFAIPILCIPIYILESTYWILLGILISTTQKLNLSKEN